MSHLDSGARRPDSGTPRRDTGSSSKDTGQGSGGDSGTVGPATPTGAKPVLLRVRSPHRALAVPVVRPGANVMSHARVGVLVPPPSIVRRPAPATSRAPPKVHALRFCVGAVRVRSRASNPGLRWKSEGCESESCTTTCQKITGPGGMPRPPGPMISRPGASMRTSPGAVMPRR